MAQRKYNKGTLQIAIGAACLVGAWYYGQVSSAGNSPDLKAERPALKAEDLVWDNQSRTAPPVASGSVANLAEHVNMAVPELAGNRQTPLVASSTSNQPTREGPMIVEPDFSNMAKNFEHNITGNQMANVARVPQLPLSFAPQTGLDNGAQLQSGIANSSGAGEVSVLAKPVLPIANDIGSQGLAPISSRAASSIELKENGFRMHVVRAGETLQALSREYFGSPDYYLDIYVANQDVLTSPGAVRNGMSLRIPLADNE